MGRGAEAGKGDDSVDTGDTAAPKMTEERSDAPSTSVTTESNGGRPPSGAGAYFSVVTRLHFLHAISRAILTSLYFFYFSRFT